jgi:DNA-binding transcriptional LysR family regulator
MDINLARTFLEVLASGSFGIAAERLHLTQTAVSARIRALEEQLGRRLFVRNKAGARLTPAGERFVHHAVTLIQVWERARYQVALPPGREDVVSLGGELSLWQPLLTEWLIWMHQECPEFALRADVDSPVRLLDRVQEGSLSDPDGAMIPGQYIHVDWGPTFAASHQGAFPELASPPVSISLGPLALAYLLTAGGSGYFRIGTVNPFLADGRLRRVAGTPEFSHSAYAVYATRRDLTVINRVLDGLKTVAAGHERPGLANISGAQLPVVS